MLTNQCFPCSSSGEQFCMCSWYINLLISCIIYIHAKIQIVIEFFRIRLRHFVMQAYIVQDHACINKSRAYIWSVMQNSMFEETAKSCFQQAIAAFDDRPGAHLYLVVLNLRNCQFCIQDGSHHPWTKGVTRIPCKR